MKLGDLLARNKETIELIDDQTYTQVTIRLWNKGVCKRDEIKGSEIKSSSRYIVSKNQFIISKIDARHGAFGIVPDELDGAIITGDFLSYNIDTTKISVEYFYWFFSQQKFTDLCARASSGTTNRIRLNEQKFLDVPIEIPGIPEQKRIVQRILKVNSGKEEIINQIHHNKHNLSNLRQAILREAMRGKLVPQDENDEPASELLKRIAAERKRLLKEKKIGKQKSLQPIAPEEVPYGLPKGWEWVRMESLFRFIDYRGKTPPKTDSGVPLITAKNVKMGYLSENPQEYISEATYTRYMTRGFPEHMDVLITTEAPLGNVANLTTEAKVAFAQRVIILQPFGIVDKVFFKYALMNPLFQELLNEKKSGTTAKGIKSARLKQLPVPLPPLSEQKRIVEKIDALTKYCDLVEARIAENQKHTTALMNAVLREEFQTKGEQNELV